MVVHVLIANMLAPDPATVSISKAAPDLRAEVPLQWAAFPDFLAEDPIYHDVNRVALRWRLANLTDPTQPEVEVPQSRLTFHPSDGSNPLPWLGHDAPLPAAVVTGDTYRVTLRVEDAADPAVGHEVSRDVGIDP
jgi:hypothetical protein